MFLFLSYSVPLFSIRFLSHFSLSLRLSSPKNRQVRYYRRHITNAELVVIDWMPGTWICQLMRQTNPFRSSFSPRSPSTILRFYVCRTSANVSRACYANFLEKWLLLIVPHFDLDIQIYLLQKKYSFKLHLCEILFINITN